VSSNRDFGVEQFFRADEFRAVDPSPVVSSSKPKKELTNSASSELSGENLRS
jgi:hypothetical protein